MKKTILFSLLALLFGISFVTYGEDYCSQSAGCRSTPENPLQICADLKRLCAQQQTQQSSQNTVTQISNNYDNTEIRVANCLNDYVNKYNQFKNKFDNAIENEEYNNAIDYIKSIKDYLLSMKKSICYSYASSEINEIYSKLSEIEENLDTALINQNVQEVANDIMACQDSYGKNATAGKDKNTCECLSGYAFNVKQTACISLKDIEFEQAINRMYDNGLTSYNTIEKFMGNDYLTREQASKFFVQFGKKVLGKVVDNKKIVHLKDIKKADTTLQTYIKEANQLGLFKGVNENFLPFDKLTIAQAIAVIIRANNGFQDETQTQWYKKYYDIVNNYGMLEGLGFNINTLDYSNIKRKEVALLLYRLNNYILREDSSIKLCQSTYGEFSNSEGIVNSSGSYDCTCKEGYGFDENQPKCIVATDKMTCQDTFGKYSYTDWTLDDKGGYNCYCKEGYVINESLGKCIPANEDCQQIFGKYSYRDQTIARDSEWKYTCDCQEGYDRESEAPNAQCVKK